MWLDESWNPAVPGINMDGNYWEHYAADPLHWVKTELEVCRNYHPMFMQMAGADGKYCHGEGADWWRGGCVNHSGVSATLYQATVVVGASIKLQNRNRFHLKTLFAS